MHGIYSFLVGPMAWAAFIIFIGGSIYKLWSMYRLTKTRDAAVFEYMDLKYSLRSIFHWIVPFGAVNWKKHPAVTVFTFVFHICLILLPIFLLAHVYLWEYYWGFSFGTLSEHTADVMTVLVILAVIFFGVRRVVRPEVRYVTTYKDWVILVLVALPFVTGLLAHYQVGPYKFMLVLHILSGEIWLAAIPFTRLSHMLLSPFTRAYIGSEFGAVRNAKDW